MIVLVVLISFSSWIDGLIVLKFNVTYFYIGNLGLPTTMLDLLG